MIAEPDTMRDNFLQKMVFGSPTALLMDQP